MEHKGLDYNGAQGVLSSEYNENRPFRGLYYFWLLTALFAAVFLFWSKVNSVSISNILNSNMSLYFVIILLHILYRLAQGKPYNLLAPDNLFIFFYTLFHCSYLMLLALDITDFSEFFIPYPDVLVQAMLIVNIGLIFFILGYEAMASDSIKQDSNDPSLRHPASLWNTAGKTIMIFFFAVHIIFIITFGIGQLKSGGYIMIANISQYGVRPYFFLFSTIFFNIGLIMYCSYCALTARRLFIDQVSALVTAGFVCILLLEGDRGPVINYVISLALIYNYVIRRITFKEICMAVTLGAGLFSVIAVVRNSAAFDPLGMYNEFSVVSRQGGFDWKNVFIEPGGSIRTLIAAIAYVPKLEPFLLGRSMLFSLLGLIPFLAGSLRSPIMDNPSLWITKILNPSADNPAGAGSLVTMEAYINFGYVGVIIMLFCIGGLLRVVSGRYMRNKNIMNFCTLIITVCYFVYWVRQDMSVIVRTIVWAVCIFFLINNISARRRG